MDVNGFEPVDSILGKQETCFSKRSLGHVASMRYTH